MKANLSEQYPIIEKLEYNYLVNEDIYSLNTLMSLLHDKNFIYFSKNNYYVKDYVLKNLKKYFWNLRDIDQVIDSLDRLISSAIYRYEYIISIKAQYRAFREKKMVDQLEYVILDQLGVDYLIESTNFNYNRFDPKIIEISKNFKNKIYEDRSLVKELNKDIRVYADKMLMKKIYNIDTTTHKQLSFDTDSIYTEDITSQQSKKMYEKTLTYLYKSIVDTYAEYYFRGLIREVFKRYQ
ncbi:hypothetical protein [Anaerococcus tetradius]|uniref:Uncharacterized protein n=2 Tax=Anaerococcus tetradius TaxID=33036 RepID=C2CFR5_9FIRM|nr:hypothetical protein [Anaerococcus tetradius]EEI83596.1 hypothetical protein HMPREF0077_0325 [Anaerococcus tetradius ATCC 35098]KWZ77525.1 hypothetical protein HMPREF3200_01345 [Anaerococcus tetradius]